MFLTKMTWAGAAVRLPCGLSGEEPGASARPSCALSLGAVLSSPMNGGHLVAAVCPGIACPLSICGCLLFPPRRAPGIFIRRLCGDHGQVLCKVPPRFGDNFRICRALCMGGCCPHFMDEETGPESLKSLWSSLLSASAGKSTRDSGNAKVLI